MNKDYKIHTPNSILKYRANTFFTKEPETIEWIDNYVDGVFWDIGANIGYFTVLMANLVGSSGKIFSFEPEPLNFKILQKNIEQNHLENVVLEQSAVGDTDGKIKLYLSNTNSGWHKVFPTQFVDYEVSDKNIDVNICSLDKAFSNQKIDRSALPCYNHQNFTIVKRS